MISEFLFPFGPEKCNISCEGIFIPKKWNNLELRKTMFANLIAKSVDTKEKELLFLYYTKKASMKV